MLGKERKTWSEEVLSDFEFDGCTLNALKDKVENLIAKHGSAAYFHYDYYGYDGACDVNLYITVTEDDSTYNERLVQEALKEQQSKEKAAKKAQEKAGKLAVEAGVKEAQERELFEKLKEKYGNT